MVTWLPVVGTPHRSVLLQANHAGAALRPSPNHGARRGDERPSLVVLHYTAMADTETAIQWLCDPSSEVSAHYVIDRDGAISQLVAEADRARHAGAGAWASHQDVNSASIGIEMSNTGAAPFPEPLMTSLERLLAGMMDRWRIPPRRVIGHSDCAPGRKIDPGTRFDWARLARGGLAQETPAPITPDASLDQDLRACGYTADVSQDVRLEAFRLRYLPDTRGPATDLDRGIAAALAQRAPVDRGPSAA